MRGAVKKSDASNDPRRAGRGRRAVRGLRTVYAVSLVVGLVLLAGALARPGVFVVPPGPATPSGVTYLYLGRNDELRLVDSPAGVCIRALGAASPVCRETALRGFAKLHPDHGVRRIALPFAPRLYRRSARGGRPPN